MNWLVVVERDLSAGLAMRTHVLEFCRALAELEPVCLASQTPAEALSGDLPFATFQLPAPKIWPNALGQTLASRAASQRIAQLAAQGRVEVVYVRAASHALGPLRAARRLGLPAILEVNGAWSEEQRLSLNRYPAWRRPLVRQMQALRSRSYDQACRLASQVVVVTPQLGQYLERRGIPASKIQVVPNGVNLEHFQPRDRLESRRALQVISGLELSDNDPLVGFAGGLAAWQGLEGLVEAFSGLPEPAHGRRKLLIAGSGPEQPALARQIARLGQVERIHLLGRLPYTQIPTFLAACDLLAAPKRPLASGYSALKVLEYLACARPVLATRLEGMEMIEQSGAGRLVPADDNVAMRKTLQEMLELPASQQAEMGQRGREWVEQNASWQRAAERVRALVQR
jgi:glycosyltransferase involved in cell wall biosynthesis